MQTPDLTRLYLSTTTTPYNMNILLLKNPTTPRDFYQELFVDQKGHNTVFVPLLQHSPVNIEPLKQHIANDVNDIDAVIVTSHRAVEILGEYASPALLSKPAYTVGPATARCLRELGFTDVRGEETGNGAALVPQLLSDGYQRFAFYAGKVRRDTIPNKLREAGRSLVEFTVYQTVDLDDIAGRFERAVSELPKGAKDNWICFFAPSGTSQIVEYLKQNPGHGFKIASIGPTTLEYLEKNGIEVDVTAKQPDPEHFLEAMLSKTD